MKGLSLKDAQDLQATVENLKGITEGLIEAVNSCEYDEKTTFSEGFAADVDFDLGTILKSIDNLSIHLSCAIAQAVHFSKPTKTKEASNE